MHSSHGVLCRLSRDKKHKWDHISGRPQYMVRTCWYVKHPTTVPPHERRSSRTRFYRNILALWAWIMCHAKYRQRALTGELVKVAFLTPQSHSLHVRQMRCLASARRGRIHHASAVQVCLQFLHCEASLCRRRLRQIFGLVGFCCQQKQPM